MLHSVMTVTEWAEEILDSHELHSNLDRLDEYVEAHNATNKH